MVCTDGAPCPGGWGGGAGFVGLLREREKRRILSFTASIIRRMRGEQLGDVVAALLSTLLLPETLTQFKTMLDEVGNNHPGPLPYSNVRWLPIPSWFHYLVVLTEHLNQAALDLSSIPGVSGRDLELQAAT